MKNTSKTSLPFAASTALLSAAVVTLSLVFVVDLDQAAAYLRDRTPTGLREAAPTQEQQAVQSDLAARTRRLADQYSNRQYGLDADTEDMMEAMEEPGDAMSADADEAPLDFPMAEQTYQPSRMTTTVSATSPVAPSYQEANIISQPLERQAPALPSSGFGASISAIALALTIFFYRKKIVSALV